MDRRAVAIAVDLNYMKRSAQLDKAANELADLLERHFAKLPASQRAAREKAFHEAVAKVGTRAESEEFRKLRRAVPQSDGAHSFQEFFLRREY